MLKFNGRFIKDDIKLFSVTKNMEDCMVKKILILIMIVIISLVACTTKSEGLSEPANIKILYNDIEQAPFLSDWLLLEEYEKRYDVILDVSLGDNTDYEKAIDLNIQLDNPPDVILKCWPESIENYANEGFLLPISDYVYLMPFYQAYIEEMQLESEIEKLKMANGKYYILPGYKREIQVQQWIYREDLFVKNNIPTPKTYEELFNALLILKEKYPDSTPITASWGGAHLLSMMGAGYEIPAGWSGNQYFNEAIKQWEFAPATSNYKEMYKFLNRCYEAGILDPDIFTQSNEDFVEKIENGKAMITVTWITSGFDNWNQSLEKNGVVGGNWVALPVLESTIGSKALPPVDTFNKGLVIHSNALNKPYFEKLIQFIDWAVYSKEGMELTTYGVEGITYQKTNDGYDFLPTIITPKNNMGTVDIKTEYGFNLFFNLVENESFEDFKKPDEIVAFLSSSEKNNESLNISPILLLNKNDLEVINLINELLLPYVEESSVKFITGDLDIDKDWEKYLNILEDKGYKIIERIWNDAWLSK